MILDITMFKDIFGDENLSLPAKWDGKDFEQTLAQLFDLYCRRVEWTLRLDFKNKGDRDKLPVKLICSRIKRAVRYYLNGFPAKAYNALAAAMELLIETPLRVYKKSCSELFEGRDRLDLFRVVSADGYKQHERARVFHTPYDLRGRVATYRYSIAGFPSLYLGTSLELCCKEAGIDVDREFGERYHQDEKYAIASKFKIERSILYCEADIEVIEMAVKPQDFWRNENGERYLHRVFDEIELDTHNVMEAYLRWYPLIAASSFIRFDKSDHFAPEYIVPQLLMQWLRQRMANYGNRRRLTGIRYFSCASEDASEMGFNYVFPTSGHAASPELQYCPVLIKAFKLTKPRLLCDYGNILECEGELVNDNDVQNITDTAALRA